MATPKRERFIALFFAVLFIGSTLAFTVVIIIDNLSRSDDSLADTTSLNEQQTQSTETTEGSLEGTQLENFTPVTEVTELQSTDTTVGEGQEVQPGETVTVDYTGAVAATGVIFQSSLDSGQPVTFGLDQVITGWTDGVPGMKVGGTRRLIIPAEQAYGANPPQGSGIPANAPLVFDITLHAIGE